MKFGSPPAEDETRPYMLVAINWPPFTAPELPPILVNELEGILEPLYLATHELHRTVYRYELLAALGRDWEFVNKAAVTSAGHYEYRYGYDRHAAWRGHWIFVR